MGACIIGVGHSLPERVVSNAELVELGVETTPDWIVSKTGIHSRRWAESRESTASLGTSASRKALAHASIGARDVDLLICATSSPEYAVPATANRIAHELDMHCGAFDLNAACSGFVHALLMGYAACEQPDVDTVLSHVVLVGFGAGLAWSAACIRLAT